VRLVFDDQNFFLRAHVLGVNPGVTVCCITFDVKGARSAYISADELQGILKEVL
jgi:hypothetical protein